MDAKDISSERPTTAESMKSLTLEEGTLTLTKFYAEFHPAFTLRYIKSIHNSQLVNHAP